ncbi:MAG TPA: DUF1501 domain-containing protein [Verrucomicrobiae bacterium]|nr:DUF1501 domain-containing protein [Verrucomicrobiae bacterium]
MTKEIIQTRREFLRRSLFFLATSYSAPFFLTRTVLALDSARANASTASLPGMPDERVLVVVQMGGGNDGLNTVVPYGLDDYYRVRNTIYIEPDRVLKLNDTVGLHPNLARLKAMYDDGRMAIVQGVGYPNPDRSHFRSMEIWHTADPQSKTVAYGWLGRYVDNECPGCDAQANRINPMGAIGLNSEMPLALKSRRGLSIAMDNPDAFRWTPLAEEARDPKHAAATFEKLNHVVTASLDNPEIARLDFLSRVAMNAELSSTRIREIVKKYKPGPVRSYPNSGLARQLQTVAELIGGGLDTRVYYVSLGGFDTHANELGTHGRLMTELSEGIDAFYSDLDRQGNGDRVLTMTFSEFGRRVAQNASDGTDHGTAAPMFLFGRCVKPGIYGTHPDLQPDKLDHGDLKFATDFRSVYSTVLENWLGAKSAPILGQSFEKLAFV